MEQRDVALFGFLDELPVKLFATRSTVSSQLRTELLADYKSLDSFTISARAVEQNSTTRAERADKTLSDLRAREDQE